MLGRGAAGEMEDWQGGQKNGTFNCPTHAPAPNVLFKDTEKDLQNVGKRPIQPNKILQLRFFWQI